MRIIDADVLKELAFESEDWWENADVWIVSNLIDSVPTIYESKEGKWLETQHTNQKRCSNCDRICFIAIYPWFGGQAKYCPACGVKMEQKLEVKILEDEIWEEFDSGLELLKSVK